MSLGSPVIEPMSFRKALGHFASGITVITSDPGDEPVGFTCQSFYSVSVNPPLVSFSVMATSASYPKIRQAGRFAVNILSDEQSTISNQFAQRGADKWQDVGRQTSPLGNPLIAGSLNWLDCELHAEYEAGDHVIVVGEVKAMNVHGSSELHPLLYFKGRYCTLDKPGQF